MEKIIPSLIVSVREPSGWFEMPSMRLPQNTLICCLINAALSSKTLAEATVIVSARQATKLRTFETILEIAECLRGGIVRDANLS